MLNIVTKLLIITLAVTLQYHVAESVYCYVCTAYNPACTDPMDPAAASQFLEPCNGQCVVYINPNTGVLARTCSWYIGIMSTQPSTSTIDGVSYTFCDTNSCNANTADVKASTTTVPPTTTTVPTTTISATTIPATTTVPCTKTCLNNGNLNTATCECVCLPLYSGALCENVNCDAQYSFCVDFQPADCAQDSIKLMCPKLCNAACAAGATTTVPTTTTTTPTTTTTTTTAVPTTTPIAAACGGITCQNSGTLDLATCTCKCVSTSVTGTYCENINCFAADDPVCVYLTCTSFEAAKFLCVQKCNPCNLVLTTTTPTTTTTTIPTTTTTTPTTTTTTPTTTTTTPAITTTVPTTTIPATTNAACPGVVCQNAGSLDAATCKCNCVTNTFGPYCEYVNCNAADDTFCNFVACDIDLSIKFFCIKKCNTCNGQSGLITLQPMTAPAPTTTTTPTTTTSTTTSTTTYFDPCAGVTCKFGGQPMIDSATKTCQCTCLDNFYGPDCGNFNFTVLPTLVDPIECEFITCGAIDSITSGYCPLKCLFCGGKGCENAGILKSNCQCECLPRFTGTFCEKDISGCVDDPACGNQFPSSYCGIEPFIDALCPRMCKTC